MAWKGHRHDRTATARGRRIGHSIGIRGRFRIRPESPNPRESDLVPTTMERPTIEVDSPTNTTATEAFVSRLKEYRHRIFAFIAKQIVRPEDVDDVFQRTSLVLWKKRHDYDPSGSYFHWACGIAYNEIRNYLTVQRRNRLHFDDELIALLAREAEQDDERSRARLAALRSCLSTLSDTQQSLLQRYYSGAATITEIAASSDRSRAAVHKQLARLRNKLRHCLRLRLSGKGGDR